MNKFDKQKRKLFMTQLNKLSLHCKIYTKILQSFKKDLYHLQEKLLHLKIIFFAAKGVEV